MDNAKDYGYLTEDMYKVEYLQQVVQDFIDKDGIADIDPMTASGKEKETLIEYFHHFYALMEYQSILYTRIRLMDDEGLRGLEDAIVMICTVLGLRHDEGIIEFHQNMKQECRDALTHLTGEDMDSFEGIDIDFRW